MWFKLGTVLVLGIFLPLVELVSEETEQFGFELILPFILLYISASFCSVTGGSWWEAVGVVA